MTAAVASPPAVAQGPLADSLKRNRDALNAKFAMVKKSGARIDAVAFLDHLRDNLDPIIRAVAAEFAEKTDATTLALYDLSLELFAASLLGPQAKSPVIDGVWRKLLPAMPKLLAREPARIAGSACNAVHNLAATPGARPAEWIDVMSRLAPNFQTLQHFLHAGKVLAWRAGLAQYRLTALEAAAALPPPLATIALNIPNAANVESSFASWRTNPWFDPAAAPGGQLRLVKTIGAFRGLGGQFIRPPLVAFANNQFLVTDGASTWRFIVDRFGSIFLRTDSFAKDATQPGHRATVDIAGNVRWLDAAAHVEQLRGVTSIASDGATVAVTLGTSHHIFLLART